MHYKRVSNLLRAKSHQAECKSRSHWSRLDEILIKVAKNTYLVMKETPVPPDVSMKPEKVGKKLVEELLPSTVSLLQHVLMAECSKFYFV